MLHQNDIYTSAKHFVVPKKSGFAKNTATTAAEIAATYPSFDLALITVCPI